MQVNSLLVDLLTSLRSSVNLTCLPRQYRGISICTHCKVLRLENILLKNVFRLISTFMFWMRKKYFSWTFKKISIILLRLFSHLATLLVVWALKKGTWWWNIYCSKNPKKYSLLVWMLTYSNSFHLAEQFLGMSWGTLRLVLLKINNFETFKPLMGCVAVLWHFEL